VAAYQVELTARARKQYKVLDRFIRDRVRRTLLGLSADDPTPAQVKALDNSDCHTLARMLDRMGRSKRWSKVRYVQPERRHQARAEPPAGPQRVPQLAPPQVLERIERARLAREAAEAELAVLIDHAVSLGIGWPEIAAQLGVTRQAARQHYQRRHRDGVGRRDQVA
jgi:hypothetical protein